MRRCLTGLVAAGLTAGCQSAVTVRPPGQPGSGPGGADYSHREVVSQRFGEGSDEYWLFTPEDPLLESAPATVVFLHGWGATSPHAYGAWIRHIVRKGHAVIYPRYQESTLTPTAEMVPAALGAVRAGLSRLESMWPINLGEPRLAWAGHSLGGTIATMLAARAAEYGLPATAALLAVEPGGETRLAPGDLSELPVEALVLLVVGDRDVIAGDETARSIRAAISHMPDGNVDFVTVRSEDRTAPALLANHLAPLATIAGFPPLLETGNWKLETRRQARAEERFPPDALDYYGYWKLLDGLLDAAFLGVHREYALGGTTAQRFMGVASDGVAVPRLVIERGTGE